MEETEPKIGHRLNLKDVYHELVLCKKRSPRLSQIHIDESLTVQERENILCKFSSVGLKRNLVGPLNQKIKLCVLRDKSQDPCSTFTSEINNFKSRTSRSHALVAKGRKAIVPLGPPGGGKTVEEVAWAMGVNTCTIASLREVLHRLLAERAARAAERSHRQKLAEGGNTGNWLIIRDTDGLAPPRRKNFSDAVLRQCQVQLDAPLGISCFLPREQWAAATKKYEAHRASGIHRREQLARRTDTDIHLGKGMGRKKPRQRVASWPQSKQEGDEKKRPLCPSRPSDDLSKGQLSAAERALMGSEKAVSMRQRQGGYCEWCRQSFPDTVEKHCKTQQHKLKVRREEFSTLHHFLRDWQNRRLFPTDDFEEGFEDGTPPASSPSQDRAENFVPQTQVKSELKEAEELSSSQAQEKEGAIFKIPEDDPEPEPNPQEGRGNSSPPQEQTNQDKDEDSSDVAFPSRNNQSLLKGHSTEMEHEDHKVQEMTGAEPTETDREGLDQRTQQTQKKRPLGMIYGQSETLISTLKKVQKTCSDTIGKWWNKAEQKCSEVTEMEKKKSLKDTQQTDSLSSLFAKVKGDEYAKPSSKTIAAIFSPEAETETPPLLPLGSKEGELEPSSIAEPKLGEQDAQQSKNGPEAKADNEDCMEELDAGENPPDAGHGTSEGKNDDPLESSDKEVLKSFKTLHTEKSLEVQAAATPISICKEGVTDSKESPTRMTVQDPGTRENLTPSRSASSRKSTTVFTPVSVSRQDHSCSLEVRRPLLSASPPGQSLELEKHGRRRKRAYHSNSFEQALVQDTKKQETDFAEGNRQQKGSPRNLKRRREKNRKCILASQQSTSNFYGKGRVLNQPALLPQKPCGLNGVISGPLEPTRNKDCHHLVRRRKTPVLPSLKSTPAVSSLAMQTPCKRVANFPKEAKRKKRREHLQNFGSASRANKILTGAKNNSFRQENNCKMDSFSSNRTSKVQAYLPISGGRKSTKDKTRRENARIKTKIK